MDAFHIKGPCELRGEVQVSGSKNTALPLLFTSILFDNQVHFENVPRLWDIETTLNLLGHMGAQWEWDKAAGKVSIQALIKDREAPYEWVRKMRAGILALGPLLARYGEARVSLPGGCAIGARPVNFHLEAMEKMGVKVEVESGYIKAQVRNRLKGAHIIFPKVTVTGTENILILACRAEGLTRIENAACEPEVTYLGEVLQRLGANIRGLGTNVIEIEGGRLSAPLAPIEIPPDRIETATWLAAAVATRSSIAIRGARLQSLALVIDAFRRMGVEIFDHQGALKVLPPSKLRPAFVETAPYPGFPTDMQAQMLVAMCLAEGISEMRETVFENRYMHVAELRRMGAEIAVEGSLARVTGVSALQGAPVMATDLRASASLVIAALAAKGESIVNRIYHLDRGYHKLDEKLSSLGANVKRISA